MQVVINGNEQEISSPMTLGLLLETCKIPRENVVLELNKEIIAEEHWDTIVLKEQDSIEILRFVGGG